MVELTIDQAPPTSVVNRWRTVLLDRMLGEHAAAWDVLAARAPMHHPMVDSRFIDILLEHFGSGSEYLCIAGSPDSPQAMCILRPEGVGVWQTFLPSQLQVGPLLLSDPACLEGLFRCLPGWVARIDLMCVDPGVTPMNLGGPVLPQRMPHALTINVRLEGSFDEYWAARPKKLRDNLGRCERRAVFDGMDLELVVHSDADEMLAAVWRYSELEGRGWKGQQGTGLSPGNDQEAFYSALLSRFARTAQARVYELWAGRQLIASRLMLENATTIVALKTTYDERLRHVAAGRLLMRRMIAHAFEHAAGKTIEFCTDADRDMLAWATGERDITHWTLFSSGLAAAWYHGIRLATATLFPTASTDPELKASVQVHVGVGQLPSDVEAFLAEQERTDIQFGLRWYRNLEGTVFREANRALYFVLRHDGVPVAVMPMLESSNRWAHNLEALGNYYTSVFAPAMKPWLRPRSLAPLVDKMRRHCAPLRSVNLAPMDPDSRGYKALREALARAGFGVFRFYCFGNWYFDGPPSWDQYFEGRDGKVRSTVKRMTKKVLGSGGQIEILTMADDVQRGVDAYNHVYARSWKLPEPHVEFIPSLVRLCAEQGWMRLGVVWLGDVPIAAQFWIVAHGRAEIFKLAYDEEYKAFSPGTVLTAAMMRHALDVDKVRQIDYLTGDDSYKKDWMHDRRERWGLMAYDMRSLAGSMSFAREIARRAAKSILRALRQLPRAAGA